MVSTLDFQWSRFTSKFVVVGWLRSWRQGQTTSLRVKSSRSHLYLSTASARVPAHTLQDRRMVLKYEPFFKRRLTTGVKMLDERLVSPGPSIEFSFLLYG